VIPSFDRRLIFGQMATTSGGTIDVGISVKVIIFIVVAIIILIALNYLVNATKLGTSIRAVAQDRPTAALMGINVNQVIALTFLIGGSLGGAAGVLATIKARTIDPFLALSRHQSVHRRRIGRHRQSDRRSARRHYAWTVGGVRRVVSHIVLTRRAAAQTMPRSPRS
jgi:hypothetical protein